MNKKINEILEEKIGEIKNEGKYKSFNYLEGPMDAKAPMADRGEVLILSSNNYLGLASHPDVIEAGRKAMSELGAGTASVRFICGTYSIHRELEEELGHFIGTEKAVTYSSCLAANTGTIPALVGPEDALISDELNHASIIDGVRLASKTKRFIYKHSNMKELETCLAEAASHPVKLILTDGVFSMEGDIAKLPDIVELADKYDAAVLMDDSHGTGVMGKTGRGTAEHYDMIGDVDIITSTLGKALGGAAGGFTAGSSVLIDYLEQVSRPQIFSNAISPATAATGLAALRTLKKDTSIVEKLHSNTALIRKLLKEKGLNPLEGDSAIVPIIIGETAKAINISTNLLKNHNIFITGFGYPVVPEGTARLRIQASAALDDEIIEKACEAIATEVAAAE
jgi:glycine C-acetyltransferase